MKAVIFDIDGTLADGAHREHHLPDWPKYFAELQHDALIEPVAWLARQVFLANECHVIIVTARPEIYKRETQIWLQKHFVAYHKIFFRKENDWRQDVLVKADILQDIVDEGFEPWLVIDDRPEVVEMWRSFGIMCLQCPSNEIKLKHEGQHFFDMMIGPSGAGKSTYVKTWYAPHDVICPDEIRKDYGWGHSPEHLALTWKYALALCKARLENHIYTVLDATNLKQTDRMRALRVVPRGQLVHYVVVDRPLQDKERDAGWRSPELILKHHRLFQKEIVNIMSVDNQPNVILIDKRTK